MRSFHLSLAAIVLGLCTAPGFASADTSGMPAEPATTETIIPGPARGMSMQQVRQQYGEPIKKLAAVGNPPITRWVYEDYTVYFEHKYVIDSVPNR